MGLFRRTPKNKVDATHWWRENGEANQYRILVDIKQPDGTTKTIWVGAITLNGEMPVAAQSNAMARICKGLDRGTE